MKDWEVNPDNYAKDDTGEFILKVDGTPRKKSGRAKGSKGRGYTYHSQTKAKMAAKKQVKEKEKKLKAAQNKVDSYKKAIKINPDYADAHNNIGNVLQDQSKLEEAISAFNLIVETTKYPPPLIPNPTIAICNLKPVKAISSRPLFLQQNNRVTIFQASNFWIFCTWTRANITTPRANF